MNHRSFYRGNQGALRAGRAHHAGAALIVCLLMLVVVLMLGTSATHIALQEEKASRVERDRQVALESAEAALVDAEQDIEASSRQHLFSEESIDGFTEECGQGGENPFLGLCLPASEGDVPVWQRIDLGSDDQSGVVPYGHFTGRSLQTGDGLLPSKLPRYIIERVAYGGQELRAGKERPTWLYRITALGFGIRETTTVVLQTFYRKTGEGLTNNDIPARRLSWREIPNWQELHDASQKS